MEGDREPKSTSAALVDRPDLHLGPILVSPAKRTIASSGRRTLIEPRMMEVLLCLAEKPGSLVTRSALIQRCWNGAPVGDDSLNRAVAGVRRAIKVVAGTALRLETVAGAGYVLSLADDDIAAIEVRASVDDAIAAGWRSWYLGRPQPDEKALVKLRAAVEEAPGNAEASALLALLLRHAAEHSEAADCGRYVEECQSVAARTLAIDPRHCVARTAIISLPPLFGDWQRRRNQLLDLLNEQGECMPAVHDLAVLEMATGRPSAAIPIIEALMAREPLAALFHYKRIYHLWTLGRLSEMDRVADRALQLWPRHPAIWFARFWSLAFTGRSRQAMQQLVDDSTRPAIPTPALIPLELTLRSILEPDNESLRQTAIGANLHAAARGPAQSVAAVIHLSGIGAIAEALQAAKNYLTRDGELAVSQRKTSSDPSITDQHRRVTQMLFIPPTQSMRASPDFDQLCQALGLSAYWQQAGLVPDYQLQKSM